MDTKDRLRIAREKLGLTQKKLGNSIGLKAENVRDLESGKVKFSTLHALALENIYGLCSDWLLSGSGEMFSNEITGHTPPLAEPDLITKKINQMLAGMPDEKKRDVLKYAEEKKLLADLLKEKTA